MSLAMPREVTRPYWFDDPDRVTQAVDYDMIEICGGCGEIPAECKCVREIGEDDDE